MDSNTKVALTMSPRDRLSWEFYHHRDPMITDLRDLIAYQFPDKIINFHREGRRFISPSKLSTLEIMEFFNFIKDLFNASLGSLTLSCGKMEVIKAIKDTDCASLSVDKGTVSHEEMRWLLDFKALDLKSISCNPGPDFSYHLPISCDKLSLESGAWIEPKVLLNLNCKAIDLWDCQLDPMALNQFLHQWINSDCAKLEYLLIYNQALISDDKNQNKKWDLNRIVEGLKTVQGTPKRHSDNPVRYISYRIRYEDGLDIRRKTDGMLGTVLIPHPNLARNNFLFVVWHVLNPNLF